MTQIWYKLRQDWRKLIIGDGSHDLADKDIQTYIGNIDEKAKVLYNAMNKCSQGNLTYLWEDIPMIEKETHTGSSQVTLSYDRLKVVAMAYGLKGTAFYQDATIKKEIIAALEILYKYHYNTTFEIFGNWYDWHIGCPLRFLDILFIMQDDLDKEQLLRLLSPVQRFTPKVDMTGANRVWKAHIVALSGLLEENEDKMQDVKQGIKEIFDFVKEGDGFYQDGSFVQHGYFPYTGGYGKAFIVTMAPLMNVLSQSPWALKYSDHCEENLYQMVFEAYEPLIEQGIIMDMVRNREISRIGGQDHIAGRQVIRALIYMLDALGEVAKQRAESMVKYWLEDDREKQIYTDPTDGYFLEYYVALPVILKAKQILDDENIISRGPLVLHKRYAAMDRVVHRREGFNVGIAMHSDRIHTYEVVNREGTHMWHTADGMTYIYTKDRKRYSENFWGTVDHGRLPGTTVLRKQKAPDYRAHTANPYTWVGGSDNGYYGIAGMEMDNDVHSKKSWFMFDEELVVLTSDISSQEASPVESIIENCKLKNNLTNRININGENWEGLGKKEVVTQTLYIEGNVDQSGIGYYFPEPVNLQLQVEQRVQSWNLMNNYEKFKEDSPKENYFFTAWMNHGTGPKNQSYAYVILPNQLPEQLKVYQETPKVAILRNDESVHSVKHLEKNILGINFWTKESAEKGYMGIHADAPLSILCINTEKKCEISVADPTQKHEGILTIVIDQEIAQILSKDKTVEVIPKDGKSMIKIQVKDTQGQSQRLKVRLK